MIIIYTSLKYFYEAVQRGLKFKIVFNLVSQTLKQIKIMWYNAITRFGDNKVPRFLEATIRQFGFMLTGLEEVVCIRC